MHTIDAGPACAITHNLQDFYTARDLAIAAMRQRGMAKGARTSEEAQQRIQLAERAEQHVRDIADRALRGEA